MGDFPMNLILITFTLLQGSAVQIGDNGKAKAPVMVEGPDSYYSEALRDKIQADVPVELEIDSDGKVIACKAIGNFDEGLKQASCERMRKAARFEPARDAKGKAIVSHYSSSVRWGAHPNLRRHPLQAARNVDGALKMVATYMVEADGSISSCKGSVSSNGGWENADRLCDDTPSKIDPYRDANGQPSRRKIKVMIMVDNVAVDE